MQWGIWGANLETEQISRLIADCCEMGVTSFDHADIYGRHTTEEAFGLAWKQTDIPREKIQLISKCGIKYPSRKKRDIKFKSYNTNASYIIQCVEDSLTNLQTEYLDVLLLHRPSPLMEPDEVAKAFHLLQSEGKVLHFGDSNFMPSQFELIQSSFPLITNQIEVSLDCLDPFTDGTLDQCLRYKIGPMAWSPLAGGEIFSDSKAPEWVSRLRKISKESGYGLDQLSYAFLLHHPSRIFPVTGTSKSERIKTAVEASHIVLSDDDWFKIWVAVTGNDVP